MTGKATKKDKKDNGGILQATRTEAQQSVDQIFADLDGFPWHEKHVYANWLAQTYYFVRHATRLLTYAAARCKFNEEELHQALIKGAREENKHELLALNDLAKLGLNIEDFPELPETAAYHQTLYFAIDHDGPAALVGYFLPLEGVGGQKMKPDYERISRTYGKQASTFLQVHCDLDVGHFSDGIRELAHFSESQLQSVHKNIKLSVALYRRMIAALRRTKADGRTADQAA